MAKLLLGKEVAAAMNGRIKSEAADLHLARISPALAMIRIGENEDGISYERGAVKRCESLGISCKKILLPSDVSQEELLEVIADMNKNDEIHGVLLLRPLPAYMDKHLIENALDPAKDVDGMTDSSLAGVFTGTDIGYRPCTAQACMEILDFYGIDCSGKRAAVIGRSPVSGKPVSMMLLKRNATVTICHTGTKDMPSVTKEADIIIAAAGHAGLLNDKYVRPGQIIIDVGINTGKDGKLTGDVDFERVEPLAGAITPVPGGVGSVTTSVLAEHVVKAAQRTRD